MEPDGSNMHIDSKYLLGVVLVCVVLAGCAAVDGGSEITPANETMSIDHTVNDTGPAHYVAENDIVSIRTTSNGDRKEVPSKNTLAGKLGPEPQRQCSNRFTTASRSIRRTCTRPSDVAASYTIPS